MKAGIPTAAGFVEIIREDYSREYDRANPKTYAKCMAELLPSEQRDLIAGKVDGAKINWAHICVALLMKAGYVDRVLTTNFDLLVSRACALLYEFPAIYDFAASQLYKRADIPKRAVIYLHGQRTGFVLMNTDEDLEHHSTLLAPVFEDAGSGRLWIVVGYSGESDPVFNHLAGVDGFDNGLFWIGYEDNDPSPDVRRRLLDADKSAFFTRGFDADRFFIELTQKLGIFPPQFIDHPFNHLDTMLEMLAPYPLGKEEDDQDVTKQARAAIQEAATTYDSQHTPAAEAQAFLMAGKYDDVIALGEENREDLSPEFADTFSWASVLQGNGLLEQTRTKEGEEADELYAQAYGKYEAALASKLDMHKALFNWGSGLSDQAMKREGEEADELYAQAYGKYEAALAIKSDMHEALSNWGNGLLEQAKAKDGEEADELYAQVYGKYEAALAIKPDKHEALYNWGSGLSDQARTREGEEADELYAQAYGKYEAARAIKPDKHEALKNWGSALSDQAVKKHGEERRRLLEEARRNGLRAEELSPGQAAYNLACVAALRNDEADTRTWLEASKAAGKLPSIAHIKKDSDLDSIRDTEWFQEFLRGLEDDAD